MVRLATDYTLYKTVILDSWAKLIKVQGYNGIQLLWSLGKVETASHWSTRALALKKISALKMKYVSLRVPKSWAEQATHNNEISEAFVINQTGPTLKIHLPLSKASPHHLNEDS